MLPTLLEDAMWVILRCTRPVYDMCTFVHVYIYMCTCIRHVFMCKYTCVHVYTHKTCVHVYIVYNLDMLEDAMWVILTLMHVPRVHRTKSCVYIVQLCAVSTTRKEIESIHLLIHL